MNVYIKLWFDTFKARKLCQKLSLRHFATILFLFVFPTLISACTTSNFTSNNSNNMSDNSYSEIDFPASNALVNVKKDVIKIGDSVDVTVHGFEDFSGKYVVDRSGSIHFIHLGKIRLDGQSVTEVQNTLGQRYGDCCLHNPSVSIEKESQPLGNIVVYGAVTQPGSFELGQAIKLSEAIALAGGVTLDANRQNVILSRLIKNERKTITINLQNIQIAGAQDPVILPNDVVFVQDKAGRLIFNDIIKTVPIISAIIFGIAR